MGLEVIYLAGNCPVQGEGSFDGKPFYFRARGSYWIVYLYDTQSQADQLVDGQVLAWENYGSGHFDAGWMDNSEAMGFIYRTYLQWSNDRLQKVNLQSK